MPTPKNCVFCTATNRLIDFIPDISDGKAEIAKLGAEYGDQLIVLDVDDAFTRYENAFKSEPVEISEERFTEMLGVLPPVAWTRNPANCESFKICERTTGSVTAIFVRVDDRYFELSDSIRLPHRDCIARVLAKFYPEHQP